jgi:NADH:ubiquinone oxidoreductase subunit 6 (subunit J)
MILMLLSSAALGVQMDATSTATQTTVVITPATGVTYSGNVTVTNGSAESVTTFENETTTIAIETPVGHGVATLVCCYRTCCGIGYTNQTVNTSYVDADETNVVINIGSWVSTTFLYILMILATIIIVAICLTIRRRGTLKIYC